MLHEDWGNAQVIGYCDVDWDPSQDIMYSLKGMLSPTRARSNAKSKYTSMAEWSLSFYQGVVIQGTM